MNSSQKTISILFEGTSAIRDVFYIFQHVIGGLDSGFKDGDFISARFNSPQGLVLKHSNSLFVADSENHAIREVCFITYHKTRKPGLKTIF